METYVAEDVERYIVELVRTTRTPVLCLPELADTVALGASPRASLAFDRVCRAHAWLDGRDYVTPGDVHAMAHEVLRHRLVMTHHALADGITAHTLIDALLQAVPVP